MVPILDSPRALLKSILCLGAATYVTYWLSSTLHTLSMRRNYSARRARKQQENRSSKAAFADYLKEHALPTEDIVYITSKTCAELISSLRSGELTPQKVLLAYQHKAFEVDQRCNCVTEFLHPDFSEINLDGPFAGIPVSLKDNYTLTGCESHAGMSRFLTGGAQEDALLVSVLKSLGAVPFARTTVPQTMLSVLSSNPIDGITCNPLDLARSPAGSSSGEAALVGGGGSILGFGTDLGGSIRLPAAMCNIVGFKPTPGRLSQLGMFKVHRLMTVASTPGPLARDVETCTLVMKAISNSSLHYDSDYFIPPLKFRDEYPSGRPLRIGYFTTDGSSKPVPAVQRAVMHVKAGLEARGHELIPWQPPFTGYEWLSLFIASLFVDDLEPLLDALRYDILDESVAGTVNFMRAWRITRPWKQLLTKLFGDPDELVVVRAIRSVYDIPSLVQHTHKLETFRWRLYAHWREANLDALICPAFGLAAPVPLRPKHKFTGMLSYLNLFNVSNMPAGCLFSGINICEDDLKPLKSTYVGSPSQGGWKSKILELQRDCQGFPVSVQVAAAPWRDELCLHVMREVESVVRQ